MGLRKKHHIEEEQHPLVDLSKYEIKDDPTDIRVRVAEIHGIVDGERVLPSMDKGDIIVLVMTSFAGTQAEADDYISGLRARAHSSGYSITGDGKMYILAPTRVSVRRI